MQFKFWATKLQSWSNQIDKTNNDFKQNKLCMCSVLYSIGSVLNANWKSTASESLPSISPKAFYVGISIWIQHFPHHQDCFHTNIHLAMKLCLSIGITTDPLFPCFLLFSFLPELFLQETISQLFYFPILTFIFTSTFTSISKLKDFHSFGQPSQLIGESAL